MFFFLIAAPSLSQRLVLLMIHNPFYRASNLFNNIYYNCSRFNLCLYNREEILPYRDYTGSGVASPRAKYPSSLYLKRNKFSCHNICSALHLIKIYAVSTQFVPLGFEGMDNLFVF